MRDGRGGADGRPRGQRPATGGEALMAPAVGHVADVGPAPVDVMTEDARWAAIDLDTLANRAAVAALTHLGLAPEAFEVSCLGCSDARIAALNADFRGKPQPTNVLSWPSAERAAAVPGGRPLLPAAQPGEVVELGDIAIAFETCRTEADAQGLAPEAHVLHLVVHALLHLLGYDHDHDADAEVMEGLEVAILGTLGIADPYGADSGRT